MFLCCDNVLCDIVFCDSDYMKYMVNFYFVVE